MGKTWIPLLIGLGIVASVVALPIRRGPPVVVRPEAEPERRRKELPPADVASWCELTSIAGEEAPGAIPDALLEFEEWLSDESLDRYGSYALLDQCRIAVPGACELSDERVLLDPLPSSKRKAVRNRIRVERTGRTLVDAEYSIEPGGVFGLNLQRPKFIIVRCDR